MKKKPENYAPDLEKQLAALDAMREEDIDLSDVPEETNWLAAERGKFYRPVKEQVTLRLDADVLRWFRESGRGYQTRINAALRQFVDEDDRKAG
ncbi:BrnA antitoxin family protein [Parasphingorhabdus sp.]|uniref:BrnA antitoxin family protein n=1 Tax=Parasphingorhabdus sp. TaxID=2709688 RepID=UPI003002F78D